MVAHDPSIAKQIVQRFPFEYEHLTKWLGESTRKRNAHLALNFRHLLTFVTAVLGHRDEEIAVSVAQLPRILPYLFARLKLVGTTAPSSVRDFLDLMQSQVLGNRRISRSVKTQLFNAYAVRGATELWHIEGVESGMALALLKFLVGYCTDRRFFRSRREQQMLVEVSLTLRPLGIYQQELLLSILKAHPPVANIWFRKMLLNIIPKETQGWMMAMQFLVRVLREVPWSGSHTATAARGPQQLGVYLPEQGQAEDISRIPILTAPDFLIRTHLLQALEHPSTQIRERGLLVIAALLERMSAISLDTSSSPYGAADRERAVSQTITDLIPSPLWISKYMKSLLDDVGSSGCRNVSEELESDAEQDCIEINVRESAGIASGGGRALARNYVCSHIDLFCQQSRTVRRHTCNTHFFFFQRK